MGLARGGSNPPPFISFLLVAVGGRTMAGGGVHFWRQRSGLCGRSMQCGGGSLVGGWWWSERWGGGKSCAITRRILPWLVISNDKYMQASGCSKNRNGKDCPRSALIRDFGTLT
jgi:hypothetical protein